MDLSVAGKSDQLQDTVNYAELFQLVQQVMEKERYVLIEAAAERCAALVISTFPIVEGPIRLIKQTLPLLGHYRVSWRGNMPKTGIE